MDDTIKDIYHPANTKEKLPLPLPMRYFEAEPSWRSELPDKEHRDGDERLHREGGLAIQFKDGATEYWRHGRAHREGGLPAIHIQESTAIVLPFDSGMRNDSPIVLSLLPNSEICCYDGLIHSVKNAAIENHADSDSYRVEYWCRGRRHCADGFAVKTSREELWYYHGLLHREDGPACILKSRQGEQFTCYWYGRKLAFDESLDDDFPVDEPPPLLVLYALLYSESHPDLDDGKVLAMIARTWELMPELALLAHHVDDSDWAVFKSTIREFLFDRETHQNRIVDTNPLPAGFSED